MERLKVTSNITISDKFMREIIDSIFSNPQAIRHCHKLGISDDIIIENAPKIYDLSEDIKRCKNCKGLEYCTKDPKYLVTHITFENGIVDRNINPCKKYLERLSIRKRLVIADFDDEMLEVRIKDIDQFGCDSKQEILDIYNNTAIDKKSNKWIYIKGDISTGKSYFAATLCADAARNASYEKISFIDVPERFKELTDLAFQKSPRFNDVIEKIKNSEMLVLDDFGNEFKSDFVRENVLFPILSYRAKNKLFTIITSNYSMEEICTMYQTNIASKPKIEQIKQLLKMLCKKEITLPSLLSH